MDQNSDSAIFIVQRSDPPTTLEIISCSDVVQVFKSGNQMLIEKLTSSAGMNDLIDLLHNSQNFQIVRRILQLFTMIDSPLLQKLTDSIEYTEHLLQVLDRNNGVHLYVIGAITQILLNSMEVFPHEIYDDLSASRINYQRIIKNIEVNSIYYFCTRFISNSKRSETFAWVLFCSLMGDHGPGCAVPKKFAYDPAASISPIPLTPSMRKKVIELLFIFFNEYFDTCDFSNDISEALPLVLQDASDDAERSLVFKLGLILNMNEGLAYSAQSILNCLKSSDTLIQYSLYYIHAFGILIRNSSVELILYRLLHRPTNNFVLIAASKMIQSIIENTKENTDLQERLEMIIADAFQNSSVSSVILRAFRMALVNAADGLEISPESQYAVEQLRKFESNPKISEIDDDYIKELKKGADIINNSDKFKPVFNVSYLWQAQQKQKMQLKFKNIDRLSNLNKVTLPPNITLTPGDESRPKITNIDGARSPVKVKGPFQGPIQSIPLQVEEEEEDNNDDYSSDGYYEEDQNDLHEQMKLREMIERQKAVKMHAAEKQDSKPVQNVQPVKKIPPSIADLPTMPPAPKPAIEKKPKTKGKAKGKGKKKSKKSNAKKQNLSFTMNIGVISSPPAPVPFVPRTKNQCLELNISSVKLKPRKPKPKLNNRILVVDFPLETPKNLEISPSENYEVELEDTVFFGTPRKKLSQEEIRQMLAASNSDPEEDFDIEPLPSEMEEEEEEKQKEKKTIRNPFSVFAAVRKSAEDEEEEDEEEEEEDASK